MFVQSSKKPHAIFQACLEFPVPEKVLGILQPDRRQPGSAHCLVFVPTLTDGVGHPQRRVFGDRVDDDGVLIDFGNEVRTVNRGPISKRQRLATPLRDGVINVEQASHIPGELAAKDHRAIASNCS
ncbi:hypothetical protein AOX55_00001595 [Sinorhizobium fredii CCBAU 25509]|nr:hypothetical protein AOX55_00001595 [Sinorhizobium fredii CCBAU 25509]